MGRFFAAQYHPGQVFVDNVLQDTFCLTGCLRIGRKCGLKSFFTDQAGKSVSQFRGCGTVDRDRVFSLFNGMREGWHPSSTIRRLGSDFGRQGVLDLGRRDSSGARERI